MKSIYERVKSEDLFRLVQRKVNFLITMVIAKNDYFISRHNGVLIMTIRTKPYASNLEFVKAILYISHYIMKIAGKQYGYKFNKGLSEMESYLRRDGLLTISLEESSKLPVAINFSKVIEQEGRMVLIAGFTQALNQSRGFSVFKLSNLNYVYYVMELASAKGEPVYVTTMVNDSGSLKPFAEVTGNTCYPYNYQISFKELKTYKEIVQVTFDLYVRENFPNAILFPETNIVVSDKDLIGFDKEDYKTSALGEKPQFGIAIRAIINDFSREDIIFVGVIQDSVYQNLVKFYFNNQVTLKEVA